MIKLYILLGCFFFTNISLAQVIQVRSHSTGEPLPGATISAQNATKSTITDSSGNFNLNIFSNELITVSHSGYHSKTLNTHEMAATHIIYLLPAVDLQTVVFSANKWKMKKADLPFSVVSIPKQDILMGNPQTAADLLGSSGAVYIQKSQLGGGSPMIRGFATNRILLAVDGIRMNSAIFRSGNLQNVISLDPFIIESAEVLFGPGSVIYGSDAIGGVMSFKTTATEFSGNEKVKIKGNAQVRYSSANNENTLHAGVKAGWKNWALVTGITRSGYGNLKMGNKYGPDEYLKTFVVKRINNEDVKLPNPHPLVQDPSGFNFTSLLQKISYKSDKGWQIDYGFHYSTTTDYSRYDRLIRVRGNGTPNSAEWKYGPQEWMMNNLSFSTDNSTGIYDQLVIRAGYQFFEESRIDRNFGSNTRNIKLEKVHAYSASVDFLKSISSKHSVFYGAEYIFNKVHSEGKEENIVTLLKSPAASRYPQSDWYTAGAYLTWKWDVIENLKLHSGLRYSYYGLKGIFNTDFYPFPFTTMNLGSGAANGSIGLVYQPSSSVNLHANFSTGFRAPNVDDAGKIFDSEPEAVVVPNPHLKPEYVYSGEAGISKSFGRVLKIDLAAFYTLLDKALVRRDFLFNGQDSILYDNELSKVQAIQNAAQAKVYGVQAGLEVNLPGGFNFLSRFNYQTGEEELDDGSIDPLRHAAPFFGNVQSSYTFNKFIFNLSYYFNSEVSYENLASEERGKTYMYATDLQGNPYSPSWGILNFKLLCRLNENFTVTGGVENILDKRYRPYSSGIVAPGRNIILSLKASF